jgi:hypothetical protein
MSPEEMLTPSKVEMPAAISSSAVATPRVSVEEFSDVVIPVRPSQAPES